MTCHSVSTLHAPASTTIHYTTKKSLILQKCNFLIHFAHWRIFLLVLSNIFCELSLCLNSPYSCLRCKTKKLQMFGEMQLVIYRNTISNFHKLVKILFATCHSVCTLVTILLLELQNTTNMIQYNVIQGNMIWKDMFSNSKQNFLQFGETCFTTCHLPTVLLQIDNIICQMYFFGFEWPQIGCQGNGGELKIPSVLSGAQGVKLGINWKQWVAGRGDNRKKSQVIFWLNLFKKCY